MADWSVGGRVGTRSGDSPIELTIPMGFISGLTSVNKFGRTRNADSGTATDIWDGAADAPGAAQPVWLAPTAASIHTITSTSDTDGKTGAPSAAGARTIQVYGLKTWDTAESSEVVTLDGTTGVTTANSYVIIHRIKVLTSGASGPNVGIIKATAAAGQGGKVTAEIVVGEGQTQMAVYGVPSTQTAYLTNFYASLNRAVATAQGNMELKWCFNVTAQPAVFQVKHTLGLTTTGSSAIVQTYNPYSAFAGPGILKMAVTTGQNDCDVSGGFDLILVNN